ncbi:hypothetical protein UFOVP635_11 [uncultured Caudovirales phage]|uniref:Uncharacterized protein n=1 Tax=uncultured Caudovirales phage TaxID=2100421 RepID=A0A6J5N1V3_9CAUD|nr:hypothetical protein UFOVP635_11 [uncultured Caudovirales phage]
MFEQTTVCVEQMSIDILISKDIIMPISNGYLHTLLNTSRGETNMANTFKHTAHPLFRRWCGSRNCCTNPSNYNYRYYGARGIKFYPDWEDFETFALDIEATIGLPPFTGAHLDRIDNDGDFAPGNMKWSDPKQNYRNRQTSLYLTMDGVTRSLAEWADHTGVNSRTIWSRIHDQGLTLEQAITKGQ